MRTSGTWKTRARLIATAVVCAILTSYISVSESSTETSHANRAVVAGWPMPSRADQPFSGLYHLFLRHYAQVIEALGRMWRQRQFVSTCLSRLVGGEPDRVASLVVDVAACQPAAGTVRTIRLPPGRSS